MEIKDLNDISKYKSHLRRGFCPSVHGTGVWCSKQFKHEGMHFNPNLNAPSRYWTDQEGLKAMKA